MSLRDVLKTYSLLRQLTNDESALLETLRAMTDGEREQLVESLRPVKVVKKPTPVQQRKIDHCAACDYTKRATVHKDASASGYHEFQSSQGKSARAASLAEQIKGAGKPSAAAGELCTHTEFNGDRSAVCAELEDNPIHDPTQGYGGYHEFQSPIQTAAGTGD